jgi:O-antigen ligase
MLFVAMVLASRFTRRVAIAGAIVGLAILSAFDFSPAKVISFIESFGTISAASTTAGVAAGSESLSWRTENWQAAFAIFLDNPVFGAGLDASKALMLEYLPRSALAHRFIGPEVPHNMFLLILAETGIISFALFLALWVYAFASLARVFHMQRYRPFAIALAAIMAGQIATFFFNPIPREIWLTMALSMALGRAAQLETFRQAAPALSPAPSPAAQPQARPRQARSRRPVRRATRPGSRPA